ncbi:MAG: twin-arginine translocation signal domain-containing protein [Isosphaeraceae bacterium]
MSMRTDRRRFLQTTAAGGALAGLGDLGFLSRLRPVSAAGRAQGLAFAFGKGRVVVLGEAAQIAGAGRQMGMNVPGIDNRQMALNILHWLSGLLEPRESALKKAG